MTTLPLLGIEANFRENETMNLQLRCIMSLLLVGCVDPAMFNQQQTAQDEADSVGVAAELEPGENAAENKPAPAAPRQPVWPLEWRLVDKNKALAENPKLVEVENTINASDPFTAAAQSYFTIGSRAHVLAFKHNVDIYKATNDRNPTFTEFEQMIKQANVELKGLKPWQAYAYDDQSGAISILEDPDEKARRYKAAGLPLPN